MQLIYGAGVNDLDYVIYKQTKINVNGKLQQKSQLCPFYTEWRSCVSRCYDVKLKEKYPTYKNCKLIPEWLYASNFKRWMEQQDWQGRHLDKDLLFRGNKLYSPDTCYFLLPITNKFLMEGPAKFVSLPVGVTFDVKTGKYKARGNNPLTKIRKCLGYFENMLDAHEAWREHKESVAKEVAMLESSTKIREALIRRYKYDNWYSSDNIFGNSI